jgi:CheY-like chemotaxis protein
MLYVVFSETVSEKLIILIELSSNLVLYQFQRTVRSLFLENILRINIHINKILTEFELFMVRMNLTVGKRKGCWRLASRQARSLLCAKGLAAGMNQYQARPLTLKVLKRVQQNPELERLCEELDALLDPDKCNAGQRGELEDGRLRAEKRVKMDEGTVTPPSRSGPICLVGEDTSSVIKSMAMIMESKLWNPVFVKDGEDALRLLKMRRWDAVFLDDEMPLLNGIRVVERFRQWENEHRVARQKNVFLISESIVPTPTPGNSVSAS